VLPSPSQRPKRFLGELRRRVDTNRMQKAPCRDRCRSPGAWRWPFSVTPDPHSTWSSSPHCAGAVTPVNCHPHVMELAAGHRPSSGTLATSNNSSTCTESTGCSDLCTRSAQFLASWGTLMLMPRGASARPQAVGDLESLELKQLKRVLLRQHDIAQGQVAARPEAKRCVAGALGRGNGQRVGWCLSAY